jgi:CHAT domain-containing protein
MLAETYDRLADNDRAWKERVPVFTVLSREPLNNRLCVALSATVDAELRRGNLDAALSFIDLTIDEGRFAMSYPAVTNAYVHRALIHHARGNRAEADRAIRDARKSSASIADAAARERALASVAVGAASLTTKNSPAQALRELQFAEAVYRKRGENAELPLVLFERARALRASGDGDGALLAVAEALTAIDQQRLDMHDLELRAGIFDSAAGLLDNAIELLVERREYAQAFAYVERSRALALAEQMAAADGTNAHTATVAEVQRAMSADAVLVEFSVLSDRLVTFTISRDGFGVAARPIRRGELAQTVAEFVDATARGDERSHEQAAALFALLFGGSLRTARPRELIVVPDRFLQSVPYAALWDGRSSSYLVEHSAIRIVPRASLLTGTASRTIDPHGSALVVGDPRVSSMSTARLAAAAAEAKSVAGTYRRSSLLSGADATRQAFIDAAAAANVIHFGGHGTAADGGALLFAGQEPDRLYAADIATLKLQNVDLVVLAACDSFVGRREHVEWTPTLAHSFLAAGVPSVAGTLWPIRDRASTELFATFHRHIATGVAPAEALRQAQLTMIDSSDHRSSNPSAWAGVELISR